MTRNIYLKGRMGKLFGEHHRLNCKTVQEAMHAIDTMKGGFVNISWIVQKIMLSLQYKKGKNF